MLIIPNKTIDPTKQVPQREPVPQPGQRTAAAIDTAKLHKTPAAHAAGHVRSSPQAAKGGQSYDQLRSEQLAAVNRLEATTAENQKLRGRVEELEAQLAESAGRVEEIETAAKDAHAELTALSAELEAVESGEPSPELVRLAKSIHEAIGDRKNIRKEVREWSAALLELVGA